MKKCWPPFALAQKIVAQCLEFRSSPFPTYIQELVRPAGWVTILTDMPTGPVTQAGLHLYIESPSTAAWRSLIVNAPWLLTNALWQYSICHGAFAALSKPSPNIDHYAPNIWPWTFTLTSVNDLDLKSRSKTRKCDIKTQFINVWPWPLTYDLDLRPWPTWPNVLSPLLHGR